MTPLQERIMRRVTMGSGGCWVWNGTRTRGYGQVWIEGKHRYVHRVMYELLVGPIPEGLSIDHLCRQTACCNPKHLEPVTHRTNVLRGFNPQAINARKTECVHGHPFDDTNTLVTREGYRKCRACRSARMRRVRAREKELATQREWSR